MSKKIYQITGFDCASCAASSEKHLSKHPSIKEVSLDFAKDRLYVEYVKEELTVDELLKCIAEVETDPIEIVDLSKDNKCSYEIVGFDCAACALNAEKHLNKHPSISKAVIDFSGNRLHVEYVDEELSISQIKEIIKEVETDPIEISKSKKEKKKYNIFNKEFWIMSIRIALAIVVILISVFVLNKAEYFYYSLGLYAFGLIIISYDIFYKVFNHIIHKENPLDEFLLIAICAVGAFVVAGITKETHTFMEALMVVILFQVGQIIESIATNKSKEAVLTAVNLRVETANKVSGDEILRILPEELEVGDEIVVTTGEYIPVDSLVISGEGQVDTSSLTGEFVPVFASKDTELYSGYVLKEGTLHLRVLRTYEHSAISKVVDLISNSGAKKSKADEFVTKFARWYTPIVFISAILVGVIGGAITSNWQEWIILGLKMLIVACPCAIVISVPLAYFAALGLASKNGIVVKGTNYLDKLNEIKKIVSDKTGTLTTGTFTITKIHAVEVSENELLDILSSVESLSTHPIGKAIANYKKSTVLSSKFEEIAGLGVSAEYKGKSVLAGNERLLQSHNITFETAQESGSIVYCVFDKKYIGYVVVSDEIKEDSKYFINESSRLGIETVLLTGDKEKNAKELCGELGISRYHAELFPEQKTEYLEKELSPKYATAFIGDGINDAASIKRADVGFAMGGLGSDAAIESADVVIMNDKPSKVIDSIKIAKIARHTSIFNIIFALTIKIGVEVAALVTNLVGHPEFIPMWAAVLADTGLTVVLVINALLILYRKISHKSV